MVTNGISSALIKNIDILLLNRAMTHDGKVYSDPYAFKPERFFDEHGKLNGDDRVLAYGFGRRCVLCLSRFHCEVHECRI